LAIIDADVIVVGAGTGGLTAAAYLAVAGRGVIVVDRGSTVGGHATVFSRHGCQFDVGLHVLGSTSEGVPATQPLLAPLGIEVEYNRVEPVDTVVMGERTVELPSGLEAFRAAVHEALPQEREAVDRYLEIITSLALEVSGLTHVRGLVDMPRALWNSRGLVRHRRTTLSECFDSCGLSPTARTLLGWLNPFHGVPPSDVSLVAHAILTMHYVHGSWYPRGGGAVISEALAGVIQAHGGRILLEHEVVAIDVERGRVAGVTARGPDEVADQVRAPVVVSNADVKRTFAELVDPEAVPREYRRKVRGYEMPYPLAVLYAVLDRDLRAEGLQATNILVAGQGWDSTYRALRRGTLPAEAPMWLTSASLKDPEDDRLCRPGQTNVQLMSVVPRRPDAWGLELGVARDAQYAAAKDRFRTAMLRAAERAIPGIGESIAFDMVATPYTVQRRTGVTDGVAYGIAATPDQMVMGRPGPRTPVPGLFLVGASTRSGHGITGVMAGGIATASAILGTSAVAAAQSTAQ
jgi:phytoene dehydrogenase-like protein